MDDQAEKIRSLVEPVLAERDIELVELTCHPQGRQQLIRLLVDKVGGVTLQQCAQVNQRIGQALEAVNLFEGSYVVEVSSPGLDRPLATRRDFERALGEELVMLVREDARLTEFRGMLLAVQPEAVVLKMAAGNVTVQLQNIQTAKKAIRW